MLSKLFNKNVDVNKEMKLHGYGNTISSIGLGFPSHIALSNTAFMNVSGGIGRLSSLTLSICLICIYN